MNNPRYFETVEAFKNDFTNNGKRLLFLIAEHTSFDNDVLKDIVEDYVGAVLPHVIFGAKSYDSGLIVCEIEENAKIVKIEDISTFDNNAFSLDKMNSITVILDGLSAHITKFIESLFEKVDEDAEIIGGGAGKLTLEQEPIIFSQDGVFQDAAFIIAAQEELHVGVENGWTYLEGPFIVTDCQKNILKSLNFKSAFDVYKEIVEKDSGLTFGDDNFFDISKSYPLGIVKYNQDVIVRDPIALTEDNHMILVGDIETNASINILKGDKDKLIKSSENAVLGALKNMTNQKHTQIKTAMVFDCISRCIYLEDNFTKELNEIQKHIPSTTIFGALTLGEIANNGEDYINFYNKTCVVGISC